MAVILVVTSAPPLVEGGHLVIARSLQQALVDAGHRASIVTTPSNRFGRQASAYLANWLTDVGETGDGTRVDQVISLRYPSYAVRHPHHVSWLNHTMREYYDLWDQFSARLSPQGRLKERARRTYVRTVDNYLLKRVSKRFVQSETIRVRLRRFNGLDAEVLHPPAPPRAYRCDGYGDYLFFASRLTPLKRADLLLQALARPEASRVRCVIGGDGEQRAELVALAARLGITDRVTFAGRLDDDALVAHLGRCRAVVFPPKDEDYGFVTIEAFVSGKAVITTTDSGGPLDLVKDGQNGLIVEPTADALAAAIARVMDSPSDAERMGQQALRDATPITWPATVAKLTEKLYENGAHRR
jgi:glycosyltransferase involved in cell wall biosynthesis